MKSTIAILAFFFTVRILTAENISLQTPLTMEQLMHELRIQGGNFVFTFDKPAYARVTVTTTGFSDGPQETQYFDTESPQQKIDLFFSASALFVGEYPKGDSNNVPRKMLVKLSDCKETAGTRVISYEDKFALNRYRGEGVGMWAPDVDPHPILHKEYVLHWYYKKGDPYEAKATISFSESSFQKK